MLQFCLAPQGLILKYLSPQRIYENNFNYIYIYIPVTNSV